MQQDNFDAAELIARAKRCEEIMKLSQQAIDAEAARVNAANIKPLVWAKPTFEIDSPAADTATHCADETQAEESSEAAREVRQTPHNTILRII